jgi:hypothetical protein
MVYKLGNVSDLAMLPPMDEATYNVLHELTGVLTYQYGADREVDCDDGGYVLYAVPGTTPDEVREKFDYSKHLMEYVNRTLESQPPVCTALYLLNNEFAVVLVMSIADAPKEITDEFEEGY